MSWHLECFVKDDIFFPVNSYAAKNIVSILNIIKTIKNNPISGIEAVKIYHSTNTSFREFLFYNLDEALDKLKLLVTFS
jgi:hypothetical protein